MISHLGSDRPKTISTQTLLRIGLLFLTGLLSLASLVLPLALRPATYPLQVGDVAPQDLRAPRAITYESDVLTEQTRTDSANAVVPVYTPSDPSIARRQIERMRIGLAYISTVRADTFATRQEKLDDLSAITGIQLTPETMDQLLSLTDSRWQAIADEAMRVLEQVMRNTIREDRLAEARRGIPTLISYAMPETQAAIVSELVGDYVVPNSLFSPDQTEASRQAMRTSIAPIKRSFVVGETIVLRGQVIDAADLEALQQFGLIQPQNHTQDLLASLALVLVISGFTGFYFFRFRSGQIQDLRSLALISATFLLFLVGARLVIPNRTVLPYLYPLPAFGLTVAAVFNSEVGLIFSLVISILAAYGLPNSLDLTLYYALGAFCGILVLHRGYRVINYFWAGLAAGTAAAAIVLAYRLPDSITDWLGLATLMGAAYFSGLASASLTLLLQYLFAQLLGLTTALQLLEISRPDHPLLQFMLRNAPGSYQHSLQVSNLAEQAAEAIGADGLLTRIGAIYHDCGKALNPGFFIENQVAGKLNPHDDLDPALSSATIIQHVTDGLALARRYRLPPRIRAFISEHHGTMLTRYQYAKALEAAGGAEERVDEGLFRYPGPRPQSRETALLMLADGVEARARAEVPRDEASLRELIRCVITRCQKEGQLDDTQLTLRDISKIADSFSATLQGIYHPRIAYPELGQGAAALPEGTSTPPQPEALPQGAVEPKAGPA